MNFGEYEFVYPDGEIETSPTSGESEWSLQSDTSSKSQGKY